ncbi:maltase A3 [Megachile rotundata]|uniref:maltase A3 n=1 Tax=Megachile rotundata TaxID=143995 RepID=UPI000258E41C|nr:PREDICTED: maltase A3-like [Megachile rotundata]
MKSTNNLVAIVLLLTAALAAGEMKNKGWWNSTVFYQIYPRSFKDSNGDGVGDLQGITSKLEHFKDINVGAIWLSPIYDSPMVDFGYDIRNFTKIDKIFGTEEDLKALAAKAKKLGLKVVLDLVPNHTSDEHLWFQLSINRTDPYTDYYIWNDGKLVNETSANGTVIKRVPPNNWASVFNGSAWTWNEKRQQYYFHQFYPKQPDLNYSNPKVQQEMKDVIKYWLDRGIDGFRIDAVPHLFESNYTQDEPTLDVPGANKTDHVSFNHILTKDQPQTYTLVKSWRDYVDQYANEKNQDEKVLLTEAYTSWENTIKYYEAGSHVAFNFKFITDADKNSDASTFKNIIDRWLNMMPNGSVANWVMGNHDRVRVGTRYPKRGDQMIMLEMLLPGVAVSYYGEEIGMVDNETLHEYDFRDGARTPFQWDDSAQAGFTNFSKPWLPVHTDYKTRNLKKQKTTDDSDYKLYTSLTNLRKSDLLKKGDLRTVILENNVLAVIRNKSNDAAALLMNFASQPISVNLTSLMPKSTGRVVLSSSNSGVKKSTTFSLTKVSIPAQAALLLRSEASVSTYSLLMVVLLALASLFRS